MDIYEDVILPSLYSSGYNSSDIIDYVDADYIVLHNPLGGDNNTKSCMIFKETGLLKMFNGTIKMPDGKILTTCTLTTWLREMPCRLRFYVSYCLSELEFDKTLMYPFLDYTGNKMMNMPQRWNKKFETLRKELYKMYVLDVDILSISSTQGISDILKSQKIEKPKKCESKSMIDKSTKTEEGYIDKYIQDRRLKLSIKENINISVSTFIQNGYYRKPAICFLYEGGFRKYRLIHETNKSYRFRSAGSYTNFFIARKNNTKKLYIVEGEIEALSILDYIDDDVFSIHNTNSLPSDISLLEEYDEIIIKIDKDRYEQNKEAFSRVNCIVDYKIEDEKMDYNDYLRNGILTKDIIEKVNIGGNINE